MTTDANTADTSIESGPGSGLLVTGQTKSVVKRHMVSGATSSGCGVLGVLMSVGDDPEFPSASMITPDDARYTGEEPICLHVVAVALRADGAELARFEWETRHYTVTEEQPVALRDIASMFIKSEVEAPRPAHWPPLPASGTPIFRAVLSRRTGL